MKNHKVGEIATILVIVSLIILGIGTVVTSSLISRQKMTTNSRASAPACLTRTPNNTDDCITGGNTGATLGHCVPQDGKWYRCDKEGENNRWYGPVDQQSICEATALCTDSATATQSATSVAPSQTGACGGVKTGYGNCSAVAAVGACVYRSYAPADPHYFNQWIYCCNTDKFWYAKDTNSQDPAKGWQKQDECVAAGGPTTPTASGSSVPGVKPYVAPLGPSGQETLGVDCGTVVLRKACKGSEGNRTVCDNSSHAESGVCVVGAAQCGVGEQPACPKDLCPTGYAKGSIETSDVPYAFSSLAKGTLVCQTCGQLSKIGCDYSETDFDTAKIVCGDWLVLDDSGICVSCGSQDQPACDAETTKDFKENDPCNIGFTPDTKTGKCVIKASVTVDPRCKDYCGSWNKVTSCPSDKAINPNCEHCGADGESPCDNTVKDFTSVCGPATNLEVGSIGKCVQKTAGANGIVDATTQNERECGVGTNGTYDAGKNTCTYSDKTKIPNAMPLKNNSCRLVKDKSNVFYDYFNKNVNINGSVVPACVPRCEYMGGVCFASAGLQNGFPMPYYCNSFLQQCAKVVEQLPDFGSCTQYSCGADKEPGACMESIQSKANQNIHYCYRMPVSDIANNPLKLCCR